MDFLFKGRTVWAFRDRQASRVGAIFERDLAHGEALTDFDGKPRTQDIEDVDSRPEKAMEAASTPGI